MDPQSLVKPFLDAAVKLRLDKAVEFAFSIVMGAFILGASLLPIEHLVSVYLQIFAALLISGGASGWIYRMLKPPAVLNAISSKKIKSIGNKR